MQYFIGIVLRYPKVTLFLLVLISILALKPLKQLKVGEVREEWLHKDDALLQEYVDFQRAFSPGEQVLLAYRLPNGVTPDELTWQQELSARIKKIPGVLAVQGLSQFRKLRSESSQEKIDSILSSYPEVKGTLLSHDMTMTAVVIAIGDKKTHFLPSQDTIALFKHEIAHICDSIRTADNRELFKGGHIFASEKISEGITHDIGLLFPLTILFALLILFFTFRHWAYTIIPILGTGMAILWTMSLKGLFHSPLTPLSSTLFVLISVLGVADSLHLFTHLHHALRKGMEHSEALLYSFKRAGKACFYTSLTTAVGFFSLAVSSMPIIKDLGIYAGIGIFFAFCTSMLALPLSVAFVPALPAKRDLPLSLFIQRISSSVFTKMSVIIVFGIFFLLLLFPSIFRSEVNSSVSAYLKKGSRIRQDMDTIKAALNGLGSTEIVITGDAGFFRDKEQLLQLDRLHEELKNREDISSIISFATGFKSASEKQKKLIGKKSFQTLLRKRLQAFMTPGFEKTRLSIYAYDLTTKEKEHFFNALEEVTESYFPSAHVAVTGLDRLTLLTTQKIVKTQFESLLMACVVIFTVMLFLFGLKGGFVAMLVNLFPLVTIFAMIGYVGFPLNIATATIAAVAIGVVVDDTIHYHFAFRRGLKEGLSVQDAIKTAHKDVGEAMIVSSLIIIVGVLLFLFAETGLMVQFGVLAAISMFVALLADLYWGPAFLLWLYNRKKKVAIRKL